MQLAQDEYTSGVTAPESYENATCEKIERSNVTQDGKPYVSPVGAKIAEESERDGDAGGGTRELKFAGGRSDKA